MKYGKSWVFVLPSSYNALTWLQVLKDGLRNAIKFNNIEAVGVIESVDVILT